MKFVIFGSLGVAQHVMRSIYSREQDSVVAVIDEGSRVGEIIDRFEVKKLENLKTIEYDHIIIATLDYRQAKNCLEKLKISSEKIYNKVFWDPFFIQIEPTTKCNFNCKNCTRDKLEAGRKNRDMSYDEFKNILNMFPDVKRVQLQGLGEPLLNNSLGKMISLCTEKGISTSLTTNASLIDENKMNYLNNLEKIIISIDGIDEESFGKMRKKNQWKRVKENIKTIIKFKGNTKVVFNYVISTENVEGCEKFIDFVTEMKPDELHLQALENWTIPGQDEYLNNMDYVKKSVEAVNKVKYFFPEWNQKLKQNGINLTFTDQSQRTGFCWWPFYGMFISVDSYATPCCIRMQPEISTFGKVTRELWMNEEYQSFRNSHNKNEYNAVCANCPQ